MKMSDEDYEELSRDIRRVAAALKLDIMKADGGNTGLLTMWTLYSIVNQNRAYDDNHPAFASGTWKRILPYTGRNYCHHYDHGLSDPHIATALRKIKMSMMLVEPIDKAPVFCPICGGNNLTICAEWTASSLDPTDRGNQATLTEWQCRSDTCSESFWV